MISTSQTAPASAAPRPIAFSARDRLRYWLTSIASASRWIRSCSSWSGGDGVSSMSPLAAASPGVITRRMPRGHRKVVITKATRKPRRGRWPPDPARVAAIVDGLERLYPDVDCELDRETPFQLLCATILSAQCTDERVNKVTPALFRRFPDAPAMSVAPQPALEELVRSTGVF